MYVFDLDNHHDTDSFPLIKRGNTRLEVRFASPLVESITLIAYASFPTVMRIDEMRNVVI